MHGRRGIACSLHCLSRWANDDRRARAVRGQQGEGGSLVKLLGSLLQTMFSRHTQINTKTYCARIGRSPPTPTSPLTAYLRELLPSEYHIGVSSSPTTEALTQTYRGLSLSPAERPDTTHSTLNRRFFLSFFKLCFPA